MRNSHDPHDTSRPSIDDQLTLDRYCEMFEEAWRQPGEPPQLAEFSRQANPRLQPLLLLELIRIDRERRQAAGLRCDAGYYRDLLPDAIDLVERAFAAESLTGMPSSSVDAPATGDTQEEAAQLAGMIEDFQKQLAQDVTLDPQAWAEKQGELSGSLLRAVAGVSRFQQFVGSDNLPSRVGDFQIIQEIGRGGMGAVYEAEQLSLQRRVALKVLWLSVASDTEAIRRFEREATTVANLHHTNIVPIFAVGTQAHVNYYAMQLIQGKSLDRCLRDANRPIDYQRVLDWGLQAAEALSHAHQRGVIHRDVKPSNLILDDEGRIWLTDFGLAKRADDVTLSLAGTLMGTPRYMSPEQASASHQSVDHRSDIYSLGATLYELLTGRPVFAGSSPLKVIQQILTAEVVPPEVIRVTIPRDLSTVLMKCLAKDPGQRYSTAADLVHDLRAINDGRPILARRASRLDAAQKWLKRHQTPVRFSTFGVLATAAMFAVIAGSWYAYDQFSTAKVNLRATQATVVQLLDGQRQPVAPAVSLPTQAPLAVRAGRYTLQATPTKLPSIEFTLQLEPQQHETFELEPEEQLILPPLVDRQGFLIAEGEQPAVVVSWDSSRVHFNQLERSFSLPWSELIGAADATNIAPEWCLQADNVADAQSAGMEVILVFKRFSLVALVSSEVGVRWKQTFSEDEAQPPVTANQAQLGAILQAPLKIRDQNADGIDDLLVNVGKKNITQPADTSQTKRFITLISGADGQPLWKHELTSDDFSLPPSAVVADALQWMLSDPWSTSSHQGGRTMVRGNRLIRALDRRTTIQGPHVEAPQLAIIQFKSQPTIAVRSGTQLRLLDISNGREATERQQLACVSAVPFSVADLDGDGLDELLLIEELAEIANPMPAAFIAKFPRCRLLAWSPSLNRPLWQRELEAQLPRPQSIAQAKYTWPVVKDVEGDGRCEVLVPNGVAHDLGYVGGSLPASSIELLDGSSGTARWTKRIPNCDSYTDHLSIGMDQNGDGCSEIYVASLWGVPLRMVAECRSGANGDPLWIKEVELPNNGPDAVESTLLWQATADSAENLLIAVTAPNRPKMGYVLRTQDGSLTQQLPEFDNLSLVDVDRDGATDICMTRFDGPPGRWSGTLNLVRGVAAEPWRLLGSPLHVGSDFNGDGVQDLFQPTESEIRGISGASGEILWRRPLATRTTGCRFVTGNSPAEHRAEPKSWDLDGDGTLDAIVQTNSDWGVSYRPIFAISGKTGKRLWEADSERFSRSDSSAVQCVDLEQDGVMEIILIDFYDPGRDTYAIGTGIPVLTAYVFRVGDSQPFLTIPLSPVEHQSQLFSLHQAYRFSNYPLARFVHCDEDDVLDLVLINEALRASDQVACLHLSVFSGTTGQKLWTRPLDITSLDAHTFVAANRWTTADLTGEGHDQILYLSFADSPGPSGVQREARLRSWDATSGELQWEWNYPVVEAFLQSSDADYVRPQVLKSTTGLPRIALNLRSASKKDTLVIVSGQGETLAEYSLDHKTSFSYDGFPLWSGDCDGDGQEDVLVDDGGLVSLAVFDKVIPIASYNTGNMGSDFQIAVRAVEDAAAEVLVTRSQAYSTQAFDSLSGRLRWSCYGPRSTEHYDNQAPAVQFLHDVNQQHFPHVVFNAASKSTVCRAAVVFEQSRNMPLMPSRPLDTSPTEPALAVVDPRLLRQLPWTGDALSNSPFALPNHFPAILLLALLGSFLLVILPGLIFLWIKSRRISFMAGFLIASVVIVCQMAFFGTRFPIPFLEGSVSPTLKLMLAVQYAPLWLSLWFVPRWLFHRRWRPLSIWTAVFIVVSITVAILAIVGSVLQTPLSEGEWFAWSPSAAFLFPGWLLTNWLGSLGIVLVFARHWLWRMLFQKRRRLNVARSG